MVNKKHHFLPVLLILLLTLSTVSSVAYAAPASGVFRFPLFYTPKSLDPARDNTISTNHIVQQIYDGLVAFDDNLRVIPGLAESWTVSRDGRTYRFRLRKGVNFHDGTDFGAENVQASLSRVLHPDNQNVPAMLLDRIEGAKSYREGAASTVTGIKVISNGEISIQLVEPYAPFLSALAMPTTRILPALDSGKTPTDFDSNPVGTGPFSFVSWADNTIILKSNAEYFRGSPALDEVRFVFYPKGDRSLAFKDFLDGKLEGCPIPGSQDVEALRNKGYQVLIRPGLSLLFYGMNVQTPPLDDPDIRKALALAYDREKHVKIDLGGHYFPAFQIMPPGMPGYTPDNALLKYNPEKAANLLKKAGYPGGKGLPEIEIASASQSDFAKRELGFFTSDLASIGVRIKPVFVDSWDTFTNGLKEGKYALYRYALYADIPDADDFISPLFESVSPFNYSRFRDSSVDDQLVEARGETDPLHRLEQYRNTEKYILEKAPLIPVLNLSTLVVFQKEVNDVDLPATGTTYLPLYRISLAP